ncbi:NAD(P)-binding protein [Sporobacter termitidis]|uniref:NAD(P)-binding protein n=1 Tax=Sporobacter termitidis TaxID=44749 RepID=UPI000935617C|nr:NAD(P)-binding protein [Sporobacter termitidis]
MNRLNIMIPSDAQVVLERLYEDVARRVQAGSSAICPIDMAAAFVKVCQAQSCGKCVPCRVGLNNLVNLMESVLDGKAKMGTIGLIENTAQVISDTADCAIGYGAADYILHSIKAFRKDYEYHILRGKCSERFEQAVPCVSKCPAHIDVPGYLSLVGEKRYADAIRLIRKNNPFPCVCGYVCEHPCETRCRRIMIDDAINIRGIKRFAADNSGIVPPPKCLPGTGKKVAVIGGGPAGLTAAYFLQLMGHSVTVFEKRVRLGGMLRYGIPSYRLPREKLQYDLDAIIATGVQIKLSTEIGKDISFNDIRRRYDAVYIAIGAHADKKLKIAGADKAGVISAVEFLRGIGDEVIPDFTGKKVVIVGGGNVAMDAARVSVRLGAEKVSVVYRRRERDMTALPSEVEEAIAEGVEIMSLNAPAGIDYDESGQVTVFRTQPQMVGRVEEDGRPAPVNAKLPEISVPCDVVIVAIGQDVESRHFTECVVPVEWGTLVTSESTAVPNMPGIFAGGDCASGPATVIKAIEAGKVAAANIDEYLGCPHKLEVQVDIPFTALREKPSIGRIELTEREAGERKKNFELAENGMTREEVAQECRRCLRCDHFGYGALGEVNTTW